MIYAIIVLGIGLYIGYIIYRSHEDSERVIIARRSILKDLTRIADEIEENNRLLAKIIGYRKAFVEYNQRRYEYE